MALSSRWFEEAEGHKSHVCKNRDSAATANGGGGRDHFWAELSDKKPGLDAVFEFL